MFFFWLKCVQSTVKIAELCPVVSKVFKCTSLLYVSEDRAQVKCPGDQCVPPSFRYDQVRSVTSVTCFNTVLSFIKQAAYRLQKLS
jgi:hypothetical protein